MEIQHTYKVIRASAILTGSYVAGTIISPASEPGRSPSENNQLVLIVNFTKGSLTDGRIKIEFSEDGTTYSQEVSESISSGVVTETLVVRKFTATGIYRIPLDIADKYIKVSAMGTGTATSSLMAINAVLAVH